MRASLIALLALTAACAPKADDAQAVAADSAATSAIADSGALPAPTPAGTPAGNPAGTLEVTTASKVDTAAMRVKTTATKTGSDSIIGYDSAFGPKYTIDKDGKLVEIRKRPPIKRP